MTAYPRSLARWVRYAPLLLLIVALALRLHHVGQIEHNVDQAYPIGQALRTLDRGDLPLLGQGTSVLFANPPLAGYLVLPLVVLTRSPLAVQIGILLLNSVGVLLGFAAIRAAAGSRAAWIGGWLLAVNPWLIEYSRTTWVQALLPFYVPALAWLLWPLLTTTIAHPGRRWIAACLIFTLAAGSYLLAYALILPIGLWLALYPRRVRAIPRRSLIVGLLIVIVPGLIYAGALLTSPAAGARLETFAADGPRVSLEAWEHALRLISGRDYPAARGTEAPIQDAALRQTLTDGMHLVTLALTLFGIGLSLWRARRDRAPLLALIGFFTPIALMTISTQIVHPFYQLLGLPAGAALAGIGAVGLIDRVPRSARRPAALIGIALLIAFGALMAVNSARFAEATAATPGAHDLGALPLSDGLRVGAALRAALPNDGAVYAAVDEWTLNSVSGRTFASFWREIDPARVIILPAAGGVYVRMEQADMASIAGAQVTRLDLADGTAVRVEAVAPSPTLPADLTLLDATGAIDGRAALALRGYAVTEMDEWVELRLAWQVIEAGDHTAGRLFAPFAHVFATSGERVAIVDGASVPGYLWRTGDLHLHRLMFERPADLAAIRVGQYDGGAGINILFNGSPLIDLPPG